MNVKCISETTGLSPKLIRLLEKKAIITDPPTKAQISLMESLYTVMRCTEFVKITVAHLNPEQRARLLFGAGHNRLEQHIIHRLLHHYCDREENGFNLSINLVVNEVMGLFKLPESSRADITTKAIKLRKKVNNMRRRYPTLVEIANRLTRTRQQNQSKTIADTTKKSRDFRTQCDLFGF